MNLFWITTVKFVLKFIRKSDVPVSNSFLVRQAGLGRIIWTAHAYLLAWRK